jgi:hypothetical protein
MKNIDFLGLIIAIIGIVLNTAFEIIVITIEFKKIRTKQKSKPR